MSRLSRLALVLILGALAPACAGVRVAGGGDHERLASQYELAVRYQLSREDALTALAYPAAPSNELPVEQLGAGQTASLDAAELEALAQELPTAPGY